MIRNSKLMIGLMVTMTVTLAMSVSVSASEPRHGFSLFGVLELPEDFTHFTWVDPDALKGGTMNLASAAGSYDNLHPFILRGRNAAGIDNIYDRLMERNIDEPSALYGRIAETIEVADDFAWAEFVLRPEARFHDGVAMTASDVKWTFDMFKEVGSPLIRMSYSNIERAEIRGERTVRFYFSDLGRESTAAISLMTVLPRHYWADREFNKTTLEPPLGSGPYRISKLDAGRNLTYERVKDYWGKDLPVNLGRYNFDYIRYDYFRDLMVMRETFKGGDSDFNMEFVAKDWANAYNIPALERGHLKKEIVTLKSPRNGDQIAINIRHTRFQDRRVREALNYIFNFELSNKILWWDWYDRTVSYFHGSVLAHSGLPEGNELALLEPFRSILDPRLFTAPYAPPKASENLHSRDRLLKATELLNEAGWHIRDGLLYHDETGERLTVELLSNLPARERLLIPFAQEMRKVGIDAVVRSVEQNQYNERINNFDFDLIVLRRIMSATPGIELRDDFSSAAADQPYSDNIYGIKSPAVDSLVDSIIAASSQQELLDSLHALDRVLLWEFYMINGWVSPGYRVVTWDKFGRPDAWPDYGLGFPHSWWLDPVKEAIVESGADRADEIVQQEAAIR